MPSEADELLPLTAADVQAMVDHIALQNVWLGAAHDRHAAPLLVPQSVGDLAERCLGDLHRITTTDTKRVG